MATRQTGLDPIFQGAADFDLELIESRTLDGDIQELVYRPTRQSESVRGLHFIKQRVPGGVTHRSLARVSRTEGHSVLVVPVPVLEPFVVERTGHYDASFLSSDPGFVHAHITLLGPWLASPGAEDLARVARIARAAAPFDFTLAGVAVFPNGAIHLPPRPAGPFAALTDVLWAAFPQCPPYAGQFRPVPHLTVDHRAGGVTVEQVRTRLGGMLPAACRADRISLQWYANQGCRTLAEWRLGG